MRVDTIWLWLYAMIVCPVVSETSVLDLVTSMENYWDSLAGSIVTTIGPFTQVPINCRPNRRPLCASMPFPFPEEETYDSDVEEWTLHTARIGSTDQSYDLISAAIRCDISPTTERARCGLTRVMIWSNGMQTWTSTMVSTESFSQSEISQANLLIAAGLENLRRSPQTTDVYTTGTVSVDSLAPTATSIFMPAASITGHSNSNTDQPTNLTSLKSVDDSISSSVSGPTTKPNPAQSKNWSTEKTIATAVVAGGVCCVSLALGLWHFKNKRLNDGLSSGISSLSTIVPAPGRSVTQFAVDLEGRAGLPAEDDENTRPVLASSDSSSERATDSTPLVEMSIEDYQATAREGAMHPEGKAPIMVLPDNHHQLSPIKEEAFQSSGELMLVEMPVDGIQLPRELE